MRAFASALIIACGLIGASSSAQAGSHLWDLSEVYSNSDGTIQFIELFQPTTACCEVNLSGKWVKALTTGNQFDFPGNLTGNTAMRSLLLATTAFAALPGAPTPDYIIPDNFFSTAGDTIELFLYDTVTMPVSTFPLDGLNSLNKNPATGQWSTALNSPTNYDGATGSVDASTPPPAGVEFLRGDANQNGTLNISDAIGLLGVLFQAIPTTCMNALDINDSGSADIADAINLLAYLFSSGAAPMPPFSACGPDPTAGANDPSCTSHDACP